MSSLKVKLHKTIIDRTDSRYCSIVDWCVPLLDLNRIKLFLTETT